MSGSNGGSPYERLGSAVQQRDVGGFGDSAREPLGSDRTRASKLFAVGDDGFGGGFLDGWRYRNRTDLFGRLAVSAEVG